MVSLSLTSVIVLAAAAMSQGVAANANSTKGFVKFLGAIGARGESDLWARDDNLGTEFDSCVHILSGNKKPVMTWNADQSVAVTNVGPKCIGDINTHNADANIADENAAQGTAVVTSASSILVSKMTAEFLGVMQGIDAKLKAGQ